MDRTKDYLEESLSAIEQQIEETNGGIGAGTLITTALLSAAVGAGAALLYAPEEGEKTRKKLGKRLENWQKVAADGLSTGMEFVSSNAEDFKKLDLLRTRRHAAERRRAALIGTLVGAGVALLFAPSSGSKLRRRIGRQVDELTDGVEQKYRTYKSKASRTASELADSDSAGEAVRTAEELGREATEKV